MKICVEIFFLQNFYTKVILNLILNIINITQNYFSTLTQIIISRYFEKS